MVRHEPRNRLDGIQYLRGFCAILVTISHCNGILGKPEYYGAMAFSDLHLPSVFAVAVFFSISGFIIVVSSLEKDLSPRHPRREFARRRLIRVIPFLWLCVLGYNGLSWLGTGVLEPWAILRTMFLWPAGEPKPNVVWSLRNEMFFYLTFAWVMLGTRRRTGAACLILVVSALFYVIAFDLEPRASYLVGSPFDALKTFMGSDFGANFQFAVGVGLALVYLRSDRMLFAQQVQSAWMLAAMVAASMIVLALPVGTGLAICLIWTAMAAGILVLSISARPASGALGHLGLILGNASFSIYLIHNAVVLVLIALAKVLNLGLVSQGQRLAFVVGAVVIACGAGVLVHYLVEAPLIRFIEKRTRFSGSPTAILLADDRPAQPS